MDEKMIKSPKHYTEGRKFEPKDVIRDWGLNFNLGNAVKYLARAGRKGDAVEDLKKAQQYIQFEIDALAARAVLPNSLKTEVVMTANLREWRHFFSLRACGSTGKPHPQMLEVAVPLLKEVKSLIPVVFDDLEPLEE